MALDLGATYTLSFYAKASRPAPKLLDAALWLRHSPTRAGAPIDVTTEWRRCVVTFPPREGSDTRNPVIRVRRWPKANGPLKVWIDDVQLEEGPVSAFSEMKRLEVGYHTGRFANAYHSGEKIRAELLVHNAAARGARATLDLTVRDYWGKRVKAFRKTIEVPPGGMHVVPWRANELARTEGHYVGELELLDAEGERIDREFIYLTVFTPSPDTKVHPDSYFGIHAGYCSRRMLALGRKGGIMRAKEYINAPNFIPGPDKFRPERAIQNLASYRELGIQPLPCFQGLPAWILKNNPKQAANPDTMYFRIPPADYTPYAKVFARFVERNKWIRDWELWNESWHWTTANGLPQSELARMFKAVYPEFKRVHPEGRLAVNNVVTGRKTSSAYVFDDFLKADGWKYVDAVALHPYSKVEPVDELEPGLLHVKTQLAKIASKPIQLWFTEYAWWAVSPQVEDLGASMSSWNRHSERQRCDWMVQSYLIGLARGLALNCGYYLLGHEMIMMAHHGDSIFRWDMTLRPDFAAFSAMSNRLEGARFVEEPAAAKGVRAFLFAKGDERILALFAPRGKVVKLQPEPTALANVVLENIFGAPLSATAGVRIDSSPIYARFGSDDLDRVLKAFR